jgi:hypothetical protein
MEANTETVEVKTTGPTEKTRFDITEKVTQEWATKVNKAWQKGLIPIFNTGDLLKAAKDKLGHGNFATMLKSTSFDQTTAERLMKIAADKRLRESAHGPNLTGLSLRTLYELTKLTDAQFEAAIANGRIHANMQRQEAEKLINSPAPINKGVLTKKFVVPPFSVFDSRTKEWQDRKQAWLSLGIQPALPPEFKREAARDQAETGAEAPDQSAEPPAAAAESTVALSDKWLALIPEADEIVSGLMDASRDWLGCGSPQTRAWQGMGTTLVGVWCADSKLNFRPPDIARFRGWNHWAFRAWGADQ